jgi:DNA-binding NarL/FixJ family response regulator
MDSSPSASVRVLIVDDQAPFREASRMVVDMTDGFVVVGEACNGIEALEMISDLEPDLVLMDVQMPGMDGIETTRRISELADPPTVIVMSTHESGDYNGIAQAAGAIGFVPKAQFGFDTLTEMWQAAMNP